jgi:hypothetical protein
MRVRAGRWSAVAACAAIVASAAGACSAGPGAGAAPDAGASDAAVSAGAAAPRGVVAWRVEYESDGARALSTLRGFGRNAAGAEVVRADLRVRLSDAAGLGSADAGQVAQAMARAIELFDVSPLGAEPALGEDEKRALFASFGEGVAAEAAAPTIAPGALAATSATQCKAPSGDPECSAGGCSTGFAKKGGLRRPWASAAAVAAAATAVAACGVGACAGAGSMASFFGPGAAALACGVAFVGACGQPLAALALAINQHLCDNGVATYGLTFQGVTPEVRCSCRAELEDDDAAMQPSNFNTLPEQQCIACPKGTRWDGGKQSCLCANDGTLPNGIDCQSEPGSRQAVCCPEGTEWDGKSCKGPCPEGQTEVNGTCVVPGVAREWAVLRASFGCNSPFTGPLVTNPCTGKVHFRDEGFNSKGSCVIPFTTVAGASVPGPPVCRAPTLALTDAANCIYEVRASDGRSMGTAQAVLPCFANQGASEEFAEPIVLDSWTEDEAGRCLCGR